MKYLLLGWLARTCSVLQTAGMVFDENVYKLRQGSLSLAKIRPKAKSSTNTYLLEFAADAHSAQFRALALGVTLLLTLTVAYDQLHNLLQQSVIQESVDSCKTFTQIPLC